VILGPGRFYRIQMATTADLPAAGDVLENLVVAEGDFQASSYWTSVYAWTPTPTPVDVTPVAVDDGSLAVPLTTAEDTPIVIDVLANDLNLTNPPLALSPSYRCMHFAANNTITYTPAANYFGPDSFIYHHRCGRGRLERRYRVDQRLGERCAGGVAHGPTWCPRPGFR
jgi:hypothetical protein